MNETVDYISRYNELRTQIHRLENEAQRIKKLAHTQAAHQILTLMQDSGLNLADLEKKPRAAQDTSTRAPWGSKSRGGKPTTISA